MITETIEQFKSRGGKVEKLPAEKVELKYKCKVKTCYSQGRMRWRLNMLNRVPGQVA